MTGNDGNKGWLPRFLAQFTLYQTTGMLLFFAAEATQCSLEKMPISSRRMKAHGEASEDQRGRVKANDFLEG